MEKPKAEAKSEVPQKAAFVAAENFAEPHPDYPGLTYGDVEKARADARAKLVANQKKAAMSRATAAEMDRIEREEGIVASGPMGERVSIKMDLAINTPWLALDGQRFLHGKTYTVTRAQAADLMSMQYYTHRNEAVRLGEDRMAFYTKERAPLITNVGGRVTGVVNGAGAR